jgi:hypothetical protein
MRVVYGRVVLVYENYDLRSVMIAKKRGEPRERTHQLRLACCPARESLESLLFDGKHPGGVVEVAVPDELRGHHRGNLGESLLVGGCATA